MLKVCFVFAFYTYLILVAIQNSTGSKKLQLAIQVACNNILLHFDCITNT